LAAVNSRVDLVDRTAADTAAKIQSLADQGAAAQKAALQKIADYAADSTDPAKAPTVDDYKPAGIQGVTTGNLAVVNDAVAAKTGPEADTVAEVQALATEATKNLSVADKAQVNAALAKITAYADNPSNPAPSVKDYADAGVTGVDQNNLTAVNARVDGATKAGADTVVEVQALANAGKTDQEAALKKIENYAADSTDPAKAPTVDDYKTAGIQGVTDANLKPVNDAVAAKTGPEADTVVEVQNLANAATQGQANTANKTEVSAALAKIAAYADNSSNPAPTLDDYTKAGVSGIGASGQPSLDSINSALASVGINGNDANTTAEVQAIVNTYNKVLTLANGTDGQLSSANSLAASEYAALGVTGMTGSNASSTAALLNDVIDGSTPNQRHTILFNLFMP
jgi:hypothetical protein